MKNANRAGDSNERWIVLMPASGSTRDERNGDHDATVSDICAGAVASSAAHIERMWLLARNFGGSLSDMTVWMLERSMKTLGLRVKAQSKNAHKLAKWLSNHPLVSKVYYPGLKSHPEHEIAKKQMKCFGAMMSFELKSEVQPERFQKSLQLIKSSMSLAGVESTVISPHLTSHALLTQDERDTIGISDGLIRFSVGIEEVKDLKKDIKRAIKKAHDIEPNLKL